MNRTLHYAIALSIALHGVLLFGLSVKRQPAALRELPPPLEARLVESPKPPVPPTPAAPPPPPPKLEPVKPKAEAAKPAPKPVARKKPRPAPAPPPAAVAQPEPPPAPSPPDPAEPAAPAPAPPAAVARVEPRPAPAPPSAEQLEAVTREQYRLQILDMARGHNRYPPLARENNWEGQVLVRIDIATDGRVSLAVEKSSGHPVLDRQAVEMFRRAQAQVPLPPSLRGKALNLELRAIYNLKDQVSG
jgi:protein TonB